MFSILASIIVSHQVKSTDAVILTSGEYVIVIVMPTGILARKEDFIDLSSLIKMVKDNVREKNCGAIVTFTGIVRGKTLDGKTVEKLEYEVFEEAARKSLEEMSRALSLISGVLDVVICHRYGTFAPGDEVLYVVLATERSSTAFDVLKLAVNRVKHEIPIWKKEHTTDGSYWVEIE
ncbi:MAG: molybdenum cofactor biosynthesis protein MoaE [Candidatus Methanomethyliaceae archaeon]|nr:molybdenum cofactor biosynthesis protein MoaE [Candidatus Methanomethyliaceae archaeon]